MARFWQHMVSPVSGPVGGAPVTEATVHQNMNAVNLALEAKVPVSGAESFTSKEDWHFLELGPEGQECASAEVLVERKTKLRQSVSSNHSGQGIPWEMPEGIDHFPSHVLRPMLDSVKSAVDGFGSGLIIAAHSNGLGAKKALTLMLAMAARAAKESWRIAIVGDQGVSGECRLPTSPGWLDYLQGQAGLKEILHSWKKGDVAWVPQGRPLNCDEPVFFRHSPANWLREMKKIYSAVLLVCGSGAEDSLLSSVARMGDGVFVLASFQEAQSMYRFQDDWARKGVPFLGQVVVPERLNASAIPGRV